MSMNPSNELNSYVRLCFVKKFEKVIVLRNVSIVIKFPPRQICEPNIKAANDVKVNCRIKALCVGIDILMIVKPRYACDIADANKVNINNVIININQNPNVLV